MTSASRPGNRSLRIGIDARAATEVKGGRGRVLRELLLALSARDDKHDYHLFARTPWKEPKDDRFKWTLVDAPDPIWHARAAAVANRKCDVFLSSNSYLTVMMLNVPAVVTVHDLLALDPKMMPNRTSAVVERLTLQPAVRRAQALWCVSHATADALLRRCPMAGKKISVIPLAAAGGLSGSALDSLSGPARDGFVLAVGTLEPRKNLARLVEAYASLPPTLQDAHPLTVVGAHGWRARETLAALRSLGERCQILGHVSDSHLGELYRRCGVFCYPSLGEGFGLPVLEAMAAGAPVLTSNLSSLPEVGGQAVEYVDPTSVDSIAAGLARLLRSPERRAQLGALGRERSRDFSWAATSAGVVQLLEGVAK
jgi:alpha-1,3-rhamnosyl/mannosyltransferase